MWFYFTCCGLIFVLLVYRSLYYHLQLQDVKAINKKHREKKLSPEPIPTEKVKTNSCVCEETSNSMECWICKNGIISPFFK